MNIPNGTCALGEKGCFTYGKCYYNRNCENKVVTNADRFHAMSDQEQQRCVRRFWEIEDFADWLKQPAKDGDNDG